MVIVTTAVYWGLNSQLRTQSVLTGPLNLPAPGRRQSIYLNFTSSHGPVFLKNSNSLMFFATNPSSASNCNHLIGPPSFQGYGANFTISLPLVFTNALLFLT